jgi:predicted transcriptional regulator
MSSAIVKSLRQLVSAYYYYVSGFSLTLSNPAAIIDLGSSPQPAEQDMAEAAVPKTAEDELLKMTTEVVAAYVSNNTLGTGQLGDVIHAVYNSLRALDGQVVEAVAEVLKPAVPVRKSVTPDYLVCLEDGKKLKMLKRHLRSTYNMSPDEYRAKWGLPPDYPMVAPKYAQQRSEFAKQIGLGRGTGRRAARAKK